jgi:hypothetical protein
MSSRACSDWWTVPPLNADAIWWARLWRRLRAAPRVPWAQRRWEYEELPGGGYRLVRDETTRLLDELEAALDAGGESVALAALDRLAAHVGMEPRR